MISTTIVSSTATPSVPLTGSRRPSVAEKAVGNGSEVAMIGVSARRLRRSLARSESRS
jgi:hypothetical protein